MTVSPGVRAPRAWLQVLSAYLPTAEIEATVNTKKSSGTYSAVIPMDTATQMGIDLYTLSDEPTITASVFINQDANTSGPVNLISGPLDEIEFDFERQILQFKGRDQSSDLHDTKKITKSFSTKPPRRSLRRSPDAMGSRPRSMTRRGWSVARYARTLPS